VEESKQSRKKLVLYTLKWLNHVKRVEVIRYPNNSLIIDPSKGELRGH